jgi:hypothetical protein
LGCVCFLLYKNGAARTCVSLLDFIGLLRAGLARSGRAGYHKICNRDLTHDIVS